MWFTGIYFNESSEWIKVNCTSNVNIIDEGNFDSIVEDMDRSSKLKITTNNTLPTYLKTLNITDIW